MWSCLPDEVADTVVVVLLQGLLGCQLDVGGQLFVGLDCGEGYWGPGLAPRGLRQVPALAHLPIKVHIVH